MTRTSIKLIGAIAFSLMIAFGANSAFGQDKAEKGTAKAKAANEKDVPTVHIVIMDPLSSPLACDCVQGYAQRKYEKLAQHIAKTSGVKVKITWSESLKTAKEKLGAVDLVIGKHSVVLHAAKENELEVKPVAQLTNDDGTVHQTGLVVVRQKDEAVSAADLIGYRIFFGPKDCEEKHSEPIKFIKEMGGEIPKTIETSEACSAAATQLLELSADVKGAAIISSYAKPLLEGCGTVKKGDLRVIGETDPVPFITAFVNSRMDEGLVSNLKMALLEVGKDESLRKALETKKGFVEFKQEKAAEKDDDSDSDEEKKN